MDYKEKYEEAVEKLRRLHDDYDTVSTLIDIKEELENIFPTLKESEDNMILKQLRDFFKNHINSVYEEIDDNNAVLAWLEKQGEQILATSAKTCKNGKKPSDTEKGAKGNDMEIPNSAWTEEDEDNFKHLMDEIVCLGNSRNSANRLHYDRLIKFLDELKNRVQPREEWCDKDERMLDRLIAYFEKRVAFTDDDNPRYANWLKSLRPRTQWKPSDEQMKMLDEVLSFAANHESPYWNDCIFGILNNLIKQLKILRKEYV